MKLRIGYLKERKALTDVESWTVEQLENAIYEQFGIDRSHELSIFLGAIRVNDTKTAKLTELGIVSGDLLIAKLGTDDQSTSSTAEQNAAPTKPDEQMDTSTPGPSSSTAANEINSSEPQKPVDPLVDLSDFPTLLVDKIQEIGFTKFAESAHEDPFAKTTVNYFKSAQKSTQIRCSLTQLIGATNANDSTTSVVQSVHVDLALINGPTISHFNHLVLEKNSSFLSLVDDWINQLKEAIFGPDNPFLKTMMCGDANLTLKLFNLCGLENVVALRKTCKTAYKHSNTRFLDTRYWKKEFVRAFGEHQLPISATNEPTPYRKALFRKLREQDKAACLSEMRQSARQEMMNYYSPRLDDDDDLRVHPRNFYQPPQRPGIDPLRADPPRTQPNQNPDLNPLQFDPLRNFNDNFHGQEVYRPRNPNPHDPNLPNIFPRGPPGGNRPPHDPSQGPSPFGGGNRFI